MAVAAKHAGVKHVIWSTLEDTRKWVPLHDDRMPTLNGKYKVPHFDGKGEADRLFADQGVPTTCLLTSFYWENLIHFGMGPKWGADGNLYITFPMGEKKLPGIASDDIGKCAYAVFRRRREFAGTPVGIAGDHLTGSQMAAALTRALKHRDADVRELAHREPGPHSPRNGIPTGVRRVLMNVFSVHAPIPVSLSGVRFVAKLIPRGPAQPVRSLVNNPPQDFGRMTPFGIAGTFSEDGNPERAQPTPPRDVVRSIESCSPVNPTTTDYVENLRQTETRSRSSARRISPA
jgi:hypothetical protein